MRTRWSSSAPLVAVLAFSLLLGGVYGSSVHAAAPAAVEAQANGLEGAPAQAGGSGYTVPVTGAPPEDPTGTGPSGIFFGELQFTRFEADGSTLLLFAGLDNYSYVEGGKTTIGNVRRDLALVVTGVTGGCGGVAITLQPLALGEEFPPEIILQPVTLQDPDAAKRTEKLLCKVGGMVDKQKESAKSLAKLLNEVLSNLS